MRLHTLLVVLQNLSEFVFPNEMSEIHSHHSAMKNWKKFEIENFMNYLEHAALEVALDKRHSADFIS